MKLQCFNVKCIDSKMNEHIVGVIAADESAARRVAENSLKLGKNIKAKAIDVKPTDRI